MSEFDTNRLYQWPDIAYKFRDRLLIGNGASLAVSKSFGYDSLLEVACGLGENGLSVGDRKAFEIVNESDFEGLLRELDRAADLAELNGQDGTPLRDQYSRIRISLIAAVHAVHPRHGTLSKDRLLSVQASLLHFKTVYTTNYDLLLYWAITADAVGMDDFRDFFWHTPQHWFDPADTWYPTEKTAVLYLHGGLHLFQLPDGDTVKASGSSGAGAWGTYTPLLDLTFEYEGASYPLFVSEGTSKQKLDAIGSNAYLTFAYLDWVEKAWSWRDSLVVFGHRLADPDRHLRQPLVGQAAKAKAKGWRGSPIAISIVPRDTESNTERMTSYRRLLGRDDLVFFDATSHPLGSP